MKEYKSPDTLKNLYWNQRLSLKQIARKLNVPYSTLHYWMKKNKIPRRKFKEYKISKKSLENLYLKKKLGTTEIAKIFGCNSETIREKLIKFGIPRRSNSESKTKYPKKDFSGDLKEKAYMMGLRSGDFSVKRNHALIRVSITTTHKFMVNLAKEVFGKYGHVMENERTHKGLKEKIVEIDLDKSFEFLLEKPSKMPELILNDKKLFFSFLAGYIDADGSWKVLHDGKGGTRVMCGADTQDKIILNQITETLKNLGFEANFYKTKEKGTVYNFGKLTKDVYTFCVARKQDVLTLAKILKQYSKHVEKLLKIDLIQNFSNQKWEITRVKVEELRNFIKLNRFK